MPGSYPSTESGVELKILEKLFTREQAEITMKLTPMPEAPAGIAERLGMSEDEAVAKLEPMAKEGLLLRLRAGDQALYAAVSFVVGIYEFHLNTIDRELSELLEEYFPHIAASWAKVKTQQLRVVPIDSAIGDDRAVSTYDKVRELVKEKYLIAVGPCICQKEAKLMDKRCDRPEEKCIQFDTAAQYFIENEMSREIGREELEGLLKMGEEANLVVCSTNAKEIVNICLCCECCCNFLKMLKTYERPADHTQSPFRAAIDAELCVTCGTCEESCQIEAIQEGDEVYTIDDARCIGCGLCVPTCPEEAISLVKTDYDPQLPENIVDMNIKLAQERGVL